eukprot:scpid109997/ scgid21986/ 
MDDTHFAKLVHSGRLHQALNGLAEKSGGLPLNPHDVSNADTGETVKEASRKKHPAPAEPPSCVLLPGEPLEPDTTIFEAITAEAIKKVAGRMKGLGGPSGLDVQAWQRMLSSFKGA